MQHLRWLPRLTLVGKCKPIPSYQKCNDRPYIAQPDARPGPYLPRTARRESVELHGATANEHPAWKARANEARYRCKRSKAGIGRAKREGCLEGWPVASQGVFWVPEAGGGTTAQFWVTDTMHGSR